MFKDLGNLIVGLVMVAFLFYLVVYVIMGFPHPEWSKELTKEIRIESTAP